VRRPTKIIILNQPFRIEWVATSESHGCVDLDNCIIQLAKGYTPQSTAATLLHEILHAINAAMGVSDKLDEEELTSRQETGLATVWKHNPKVFEWLHKNITK